MGKIHARVEGRLRAFVERQPVFFVGTAPLSGEGHVNVSPRGVPGSFGLLDERTFAWLDTTGSGSETIAHLRENGRIVVMFCAFEGAPTIVRFHGRGRVVSRYEEGYADLAARFEDLPGARAVVVIDIERISDACGYGVPLMTYVGERNLMQPYFARKGVEGSADYRRRKNRTSIDGLPAFDDDSLEEWATRAGLGRITERLAAQIDGWQAPVSFAVALEGEIGHVNAPGGAHGLAAVVLATVLKHDGSTATLELSRQQLAEAITALAPAAACGEVEHPNLAAWRAMRDAVEERGGEMTAVFVRDAGDPVTSRTDARLRASW